MRLSHLLAVPGSGWDFGGELCYTPRLAIRSLPERNEVNLTFMWGGPSVMKQASPWLILVNRLLFGLSTSVNRERFRTGT